MVLADTESLLSAINSACCAVVLLAYMYCRVLPCHDYRPTQAEVSHYLTSLPIRSEAEAQPSSSQKSSQPLDIRAPKMHGSRVHGRRM